MAETDKNYVLQQNETGNPGCGAGTGKACFALGRTGEGWVCLLMSDQSIAQLVGMRLEWRVNLDEADDKVWCPKGVLDNSKKPEAT